MSKLRNIFAWAMFLLIALGLAVFGVNYLASENEVDYLMGQAQFGMSPQEVAAIENKKPILEEREERVYVLGYPGEFNGVPVNVYYGFTDDELTMKGYYVAYKPKEPLPAEDFLRWAALLEKVYGKPDVAADAWDINPKVLQETGGGPMAERLGIKMGMMLCWVWAIWG